MRGKIKSCFLMFVIIVSAFSCKQEITTDSNNSQYALLAVLYHQKAAENRALAYQAYNLAKSRLDELLSEYDDSLNPAIIFDIDETILDNSPYEARCIVDQIKYPEGWKEWINEAKATAIPGSIEFIKYVKAKEVEVFYITNRKNEFKESTFENLKKYRLPFIDDEHILMRTNDKSKASRRANVLENKNVLLLVGNDLKDFSDIYDDKNIKERKALTDEYYKEFGNKWIMLPNAMYGSWLSAIIENKKDLSDEEFVNYLISKLENI